MALLFSNWKSYVRLLTRENNSSGIYRYASDANLLLIWNLILPKINMLTHSNIVDNATQISSVTVNSVTNAQVFTINLNGTNYSYTAGPSDTPSTVASALASLITGVSGIVISLSGAVLQVSTAPTGSLFTLSVVAGTMTYLAISPGPLISVANQRLYPIPLSNDGGSKAMLDIYDVYYNGKPLNYITLTEARMISGIGNPWWTRTGDPIRFYFSNYQIGIYPVPTVGGYPIQVFGTSGITLPTSAQDATTTSQLDDRLNDAIINAGCFYVLQSRREFEWAQEFVEKYKDSLREYGQVEVDRLLRGSTTMMDLDPHERF
jgi:hypothetical protein